MNFYNIIKNKEIDKRFHCSPMWTIKWYYKSSENHQILQKQHNNTIDFTDNVFVRDKKTEKYQYS